MLQRRILAYEKGQKGLNNKPGSYFVFVVLILYVTIASSAFKNFTAHLQGYNLNPGLHILATLGGLGLLGGGLVVLNKVLQKWLTKKMDK